ncbi:hypothetical protein [uncultured Mailhella sp.]|uniref:hypothetical protein n=1 Tax=uncultured Mailhella sp. TaxID=1981031 RepID=UPI0025F9A929|nr:hypothetical protein [uncultured Mailhella sp.]
MIHFRRLSLSMCAVLMFAAVALTGCLAQNNVRLLYNPSGTAALPVATAPRVAVVVFEDQRGRIDIGARKDGSPFQPSSSVAEWVSQSLADELARQGAQVSLATSMAQAQAGQPDYIVGGVVERVWLTEKSISSYDAVIRIQTRLYSQKQATVSRSFASQQEKTGIPGAALAEQTLSSTLADVLKNASMSIMGAMR